MGDWVGHIAIVFSRAEERITWEARADGIPSNSPAWAAQELRKVADALDRQGWADRWELEEVPPLDIHRPPNASAMIGGARERLTSTSPARPNRGPGRNIPPKTPGGN